MFQSLKPLPADPILSLMVAYREDDNPLKVDLSVGVFKTASGDTPIFNAVKLAEAHRLETETTKAYIGMAGTPGYNSTMLDLLLGKGHEVIKDGRVASMLAPGGCGALRVAAELVKRSKPDATVWVSDPTWANHVPLIGGVGLELKSYPYFDRDTHGVKFDEMIATLETLGPDDLVLLHACCHNPTGADLTPQQWDIIADVAARRGFIPFLDSAYQGLGIDLDADAYGVRKMAATVPEMILAASCSKNFGLYRDRVGLVAFITSAIQQPATEANLKSIARGMYSMPPAHGGAVVEYILSTPALKADWQAELVGLCASINTSRQILATGLTAAGVPGQFDWLMENRGMFSILDLSKDQIRRLKDEFSVYIVGSGRINLAGVTAGNINYLAASIAKVHE